MDIPLTFAGAEATLLLAPPAALAVAAMARRVGGHSRASTVSACAAVVLTRSCAWAFACEAVHPAADQAWTWTACMCALALALCLRDAMAGSVRAVSGPVTFAVVSAPLVLGTLGAPLVALATLPLVGSPTEVRTLDEGITCEVGYWGLAGAAGGVAVTGYQASPWLPFLRRRIDIMLIDQNDGDGRQPDCGWLYERATR